jgi:hypothetical protein
LYGPAGCGYAGGDRSGSAGAFDWLDLDGHRYYAFAAYHDPDSNRWFPRATACNRLTVYRDREVLTELRLADGQFASRGNLCSVDGTGGGLIWWSLGLRRTDGEWDYHVYVHRFVHRDATSAESWSVVEFAETYGMC